MGTSDDGVLGVFGAGGGEGTLVIRAVMSSSCLSREDAVSALGRASVRLTVRWKARRSCFRFAVTESDGFESKTFACASNDFTVSLGSLLESSGPSGGGEVGVSGSGDSASSEGGLLEDLTRIFRPARRCNLSFGAPVAKRTRSGST